MGGCFWKANDIDIWVFNADGLLLFKHLYYEHVLLPLHLQADTTDYTFYGAGDGQESDGNDHEGLQLCRRTLKIAIEEWCGSCTSNSSDSMEEPESLIGDLQQTVHHLPPFVANRAYRVVRSIKLNAVCSHAMSSSLLLVNIIQVESSASAQESTDAAFICSGFDLTCCCVALEVNENHTLHTLLFEGAEYALRMKLLHFRSVAFALGIALQDVAPLGVRRIKKYIERSLRWPSVE